LKLEIRNLKLGRDETSLRVGCVAIYGLKLESRNWEEIKIEIGNWEKQYKSMKAKFPISNFYFP
jgi:hypothetical protein